MNERFDAADFVAGFVAEAEDHLASSNANLLSAEDAAARGQPTPRQVRELFRSLHTVKGLAAMVGVEPIVELAHAMESVLREADRAAGLLPAGAVEQLLAGVHAIEQRVKNLGGKQPIPAAPRKLIDSLNALRQTGAISSLTTIDTSLAPELWAKLSGAERAHLVQGLTDGRKGMVVQFVPTPARSSQGISITSVRERVATLAEIVKVVPQSVPSSDAAPGGLAFALIVLTDADGTVVAEAAAATADGLRPIVLEPTGGGVGEPSQFGDDGGAAILPHQGIVRVEVSRLDDALERLSALVVSQFRIARSAADLRAAGVDVRALREGLAENGRHLRDLRAAIMRARMVPVSELLERIPLMVRGLTRATGKQTRLAITTGQAELDKAVAERIFPAIVHLVRNAVDHAMESPAERRAAGKPEVGLLTVACQALSDSALELTITDDGRGVDAAAVARRAGTPVPTTDEALLELLARPGLSTRAEVTTTSGRGVGMDVVKRIAVDELGGALSMHTTWGQGTIFTLRIPLSISIVDAFTILCAGETFAVPVAMVEEVQEIDLSRTIRGPDRRSIPRGGSDRRRSISAANMIHRRGEAVPVLRLEDILGLAPVESPQRKAIIVRRNGEPFAFAVDRVVGQQEVVVRPLEDALVRVHGVSGTTDLGDGKPTLVLDLAALGGRLTGEGTVAPS